MNFSNANILTKTRTPKLGGKDDICTQKEALNPTPTHCWGVLRTTKSQGGHPYRKGETVYTVYNGNKIPSHAGNSSLMVKKSLSEKLFVNVM